MSERRKMEAGDWANAAVNAAIGVFLGIAADGAVKLYATAFWPAAVLTVLLFAGLFLLILMIDKLINRIFPDGVRPANRLREKGRTPLLRLLGLPAGAVLGVVLARLGLATALLDLLP